MAEKVGSEQNLILRAKTGDKEAYGELISMYHSQVVNLIYQMCGNIHHAEDVAQETFVKVWTKLTGYNQKLSFKHWLFRVSLNMSIDMLRKEKPILSFETLPIASVAHGPEDLLLLAAQKEMVQNAVLQLPEASRQVLVLREYQSLSYQEIAATLEIPIGTVMSRLNYARTVLKQQLQELMEQR